MRCYRAKMKTTNVMEDTAMLDDGSYITVDRGYVYIIADNALHAAQQTPNAVEIVDVGPAMEVGNGK